MKLPIAEAEAAAEPDIAPKSIFAIIFTKASPPGRGPTRTLAKSISRSAMPPWFISCPASMKNGMARRAKLFRPVAIRCANVVKAGSGIILISRVRIPATPML